MKLTKSKLKRIVRKVLTEAYEDDPSFPHEVDDEYRDNAGPRTLGDLAAQLGVDDLEKYFQNMGYMVVPIGDMQMSPGQAEDYKIAAEKPDYYDEDGVFTGGSGREQGLEERDY